MTQETFKTAKRTVETYDKAKKEAEDCEFMVFQIKNEMVRQEVDGAHFSQADWYASQAQHYRQIAENCKIALAAL